MGVDRELAERFGPNNWADKSVNPRPWIISLRQLPHDASRLLLIQDLSRAQENPINNPSVDVIASNVVNPGVFNLPIPVLMALSLLDSRASYLDAL